MVGTVARGQFDLVGSLGTDDALLYARGGFREDISGIGISVNVP